MSIFEEIAASTNYAPFILSKLSISLSIKSEKPLEDADFKTDACSITKNTTNIPLFTPLFTTNIENEALFRNRITLSVNLEMCFRLR